MFLLLRSSRTGNGVFRYTDSDMDPPPGALRERTKSSGEMATEIKGVVEKTDCLVPKQFVVGIAPPSAKSAWVQEWR